MSTPDASLGTLAPVLRAFVQRHRLPSASIRPGGRVVLVVDQRYRVRATPAPHGRVALQAEVLAFPSGHARSVDDILLRVAHVASGLLQRNASTLAIDTRRQALILQQLVAGNADLAAFQEALGDFTNALAFWTKMCRLDNEALQNASMARSAA